MRSQTVTIPSHLSDRDLTDEMARLARSARETTAGLIAHLVEFEARRLHLAAGFGSLFTYCVEVLRLSEHEAYNRIEAARVAGRFPGVLERLAEGGLNLTSVRLLAPHLTDGNQETLLTAASGKTKREVEEVIARQFPRPDVPGSVRKLLAQPGGAAMPFTPALAGGGPDGEPTARPATVAPTPRPEVMRALAPDRYEVRFTASAETCEKLRLAKDLLRHAIPTGDTAEIVDRALSLLLADLARKKCAASSRPRAVRAGDSETRSIPAAVKRAVWLRDGGRCAFVGRGRRRCRERGFLEFHHVRPFGVGGEASVANIEVRCRAHNAYEADLFYGRLVPERVPDAPQEPRPMA